MRTIYYIWWLSLFIKLAIGASMPVFFDEAYYWVWAHHLQLSYFDHPGMIAWVNSLGIPFENLGNSFRLPAILLGHMGLFLWIQIVKHELRPLQLLWFVFLYLLAPLTGPGSLIVTPDIALMFFWPLSLLLFKRCFDNDHPWSFFLWGLSLGLGFCSKYHMVLFAIPAILWVIYQRRWKFLYSPKRLFPLLIGLMVAASPVLYWNYTNEWVSFKFQLNHGLGESSWSPEWTIAYIIGQILLIGPLLLPLLLRKPLQPFQALYALFAIFPLVFFLFTSFKGNVEANWPIVAYPPLLAFAASMISTTTKKWAMWSCALWTGIFLLALSEVYFGWIPAEKLQLKSDELRIYDKLTQQSEKYRPLYARTFQMAAKISYDRKEMIYKLKGMNRKDFYDFRQESTPTTYPYYVAVKIGEELPLWLQERGDVVKQRFKVDQQFEIVEVSQ